MTTLASLLLTLVVLTDFAVLGTSRLSTCIRGIGVQGLLLALLPLALHPGWTLHIAGLALGTAFVKAVALPWFLTWAIREANVRREVEPLVGFPTSVLLGALAVAVSFVVAPSLPLPDREGSLLVAVALSNVLAGLIVLTTRLKAITQVVGYLVLENGIYVFGLTQTQRVPFLLELGVLLDVFVGVFVMGIVVFHINRAFDSLSSADLDELKEA
jgi:hydrogenase-4 component E